jgi:hypothetical protein
VSCTTSSATRSASWSSTPPRDNVSSTMTGTGPGKSSPPSPNRPCKAGRSCTGWWNYLGHGGRRTRPDPDRGARDQIRPQRAGRILPVRRKPRRVAVTVAHVAFRVVQEALLTRCATPPGAAVRVLVTAPGRARPSSWRTTARFRSGGTCPARAAGWPACVNVYTSWAAVWLAGWSRQCCRADHNSRDGTLRSRRCRSSMQAACRAA